MLNDPLGFTRPRRRVADRRPARASRATVSTAGRGLVAAALARRGARERLVLTLLLYERLFPIEVANALGLSLRQVERTYGAMISELRRSLGLAAGRARSSAADSVLPARQRKAA